MATGETFLMPGETCGALHIWGWVHGIVQHGGAYTCTKCSREPQLADLGRVLEHIKTRAHQNRIRDDTYRTDPFKDVPANQRRFMTWDEQGAVALSPPPLPLSHPKLGVSLG